MSSSEQEKKDQPEKQPEQPAEKKVAEAKPQERGEKPVEEKVAQPEQKPAPEKPKAQQEQPKAEEQANCLVCNKPIKRLTRYYRNGKFYCGRKCWRTQKEKAKKESQKTAKNE